MPKPPANKTTAIRPEALLLSALRIVWKQKYLAVAMAIAGTAAAVLVIARLPAIYQAESLIMVDSQKIPEKFVASTVQLSLQDSLDTIRQQILSATRLQALMDEFGLYAEERKTRTPEELTDRLRAEISTPMEKGWGSGRSGAFRVRYEGADPKTVAAVVNRISALFIEENLKTRELRAEGTFEFIETQLEEARKSLERQERALSDYKVSKLGELPQQETALIGTLTRLHSEVQGRQSAIEQAEQNRMVLENTLRVSEAAERALQKAMAEDQNPERAPAARPGSPVAPAPVLRESQRIAAELDSLRLRYREEHPDVERLVRQLREAQAQERAGTVPARATPPAGETAAPETDARPVPVQPAVAAELARERERIATIRTQISVIVRQNEARGREIEELKRQAAEIQSRVERLPVREQELAALMRDYENSRQNYRSLLDKRISAEMAAEMEKQQQAERFRILDSAHVPTKPIKPNRPLFYAAGTLGSLIIGILLAAAVELARNLLLGDWELPADTVILGRVSYLPPQTRRAGGAWLRKRNAA